MNPLTWNAFLDAALGMPAAALTEDVLAGLVGRLTIDAGLLAPHIAFSRSGYARNVLYRSETFEAICLCWEPGQGTAVHDHGRSYGVVAVFEGALEIRQYRRLDDGREAGRADLAEVARLHLPAGARSLDRVGAIHAIGNPAGADRRAVSLHFYAGPLDTMALYDLETGRVEEKPMLAEPGPDAMAALI